MDFGWEWIYLRGLDFNSYITLENALVIKNISMTIGEAKYYSNYDSSLTPNIPRGNGFFYPLINSVINNQNSNNPIVKITMNDGDSFNLWTIPNNGTPSTYSDLISVKYDHQPSFQNTKFSRIFLKDIQGSPVKEVV